MKLYTLTPPSTLTPAPSLVTIDGVPYSQPTQATLRRAGIEAYPFVMLSQETNKPPEIEGKIIMMDGYEIRDGAIHYKFRYEDAPPPPPVVYSKYRLVRALQTEGVWLQVKEWLQSQDGAYDLYIAAEDISGDEPLLADGIAAVKQLLGWTDEKVAQVLASAEIGGVA